MQDGKFVILCIDDEADIRDSLRMVLEPSGYIVEEANGAATGVEKYKEVNPDFVLVDMMMEKNDSGLTVATKLKELGNTVPVYMLSSVVDGLVQNMSPQDLGLTGVFQKPVDPEVLLTSLKTRLNA